MEENNFEKLAFKLFGSYKKSLISLFAIAIVLAIPITMNLVQQQQDLRQEAASNASCTVTATAANISASSGACASGTYCVKFAETYTGMTNPVNQVWNFGDGATGTNDNVNFTTYHGYKYQSVDNYPLVLLKATDNSGKGPNTATCELNGTVQTFPIPASTSSTTSSTNPIPKVAVASITSSSTSPTAESQIKITTAGAAGSIGTYIFRSSDGNPPNPTINNTNGYITNQSYPNGSLTPNQFYKISSSNGSSVSQTITLPPDAGKYYLVANAHSETLANWWIPSNSTSPAPDYVCSWDGRLLLNTGTQSSPVLQVQSNPSGQCNIGPQLLQVGAASGSTTTSVPGITQSGIKVLNGSGMLTIQGQNATGYRYYIYRIANAPKPTSGLASIGKYDPTSMLDNQFYYIDDAAPTTSLTKTFTLPTQSGSYMVVANAYANSKLPYDTVCDWAGALTVPGGTKTLNGCTNKSMQTFTVTGGSQGGDSGTGGTGGSGGTGGTGGTGDTGNTGGTGGSGNTGGGSTNPTSSVTATPTQTATSNNQLAVAVQMPGIGSDTADGNNASPKNPTRDVEVWVYDTNNNVVKDTKGQVTFDGTDTYKGNVDLGNDFQSGYYYVKIRLNNTLKKLVPGIVQIQASGALGTSPTATATTAPTQGATGTGSNCAYPYPISLFLCPASSQNSGQTMNTNENTRKVLAANVTQLPTVTLVPGDLDPNQDNNMDIQDYNMFISCYGSKSCNEKQQSDFNDDGVVDGKDYNILARGFAIRQGD